MRENIAVRTPTMTAMLGRKGVTEDDLADGREEKGEGPVVAMESTEAAAAGELASSASRRRGRWEKQSPRFQ